MIAGPTSFSSNRFAIDSPLEEAGFELPVPLARMSSILRGGEEAELDRVGLETRHPLSTAMIGSNRWHRCPTLVVVPGAEPIGSTANYEAMHTVQQQNVRIYLNQRAVVGDGPQVCQRTRRR